MATSQSQVIIQRLDRTDATLNKLVESINGNGKPGIKTDLVATQKDVDRLRCDVDGLLELEKQRSADREKEQRAFNRAIALLILGQVITLVISVLVR